MTIIKELTLESELPDKYNNQITAFWKTGEFSHFQGVNDIRINFASFCNKDHQKCLVIVPGRSEGYLKYQELCFDLFSQGFNLFIIDHRGQGLSQRLLNNPYKGYVDKFDDYIKDLNFLIQHYVVPSCQQLSETKPFLLAHSMGAAISTLYLIKYPDDIQAAVLSSPMIAINPGISPTIFAEYLVKGLSKLNKLCSKNPWYFIGQSDVKFSSFPLNKQSQSKVRYQHYTQLYKQEKKLKLGGVTIQWLTEAIKTKDKIFEVLPTLSIPTLVIQASEDKIVDNQAQNKFCQLLHKHQPQSCPNGLPIIIKGAKHELFFEKDQYRQPAISVSIDWLDNHQQFNK